MKRKTSDAAAKQYFAQLELAEKSEATRQEEHQAFQKFANFAYRWARVDRRNADYQPLNFSGDSAAYSSNDLMNRRIRDQGRNDAVVKGILGKLPNIVIGTGLRTFADPIDMAIAIKDKDELDNQLEQALEMDDEFERFYFNEKAFDVEGKLSGPDMERGGFREQVTVGDTLILRVYNKRPNIPTPLCYQLIERDQLDRRHDHPADLNGIRCVNGIELNMLNRPIAYHIYDAHPGDSFQPFQSTLHSTRVPSNRVIHAFAFNRPSQNIGVSWLDAIGQDLFDEDKLVSAELQTACKNALLAMYVNRKNPYAAQLGLGADEDTPDFYPSDEIRLGSSPLAVELGLDEKIGVVETTTRPNMNIADWLDHMARRKASGMGLSYYSVTGNFANTNYTGFRGAMLDEDLAVRPLQEWFGRKMCLPIRREFNEIAAAMAVYKRIAPKEFLAEERRFQTFDLVSAGRQYLEPESETNANMAALRSGLSNLKIECAKRGLHWIRVLRQAALENRVIKMLDLTLDFSKGQGGQVVGTTRAADSVFTAKA